MTVALRALLQGVIDYAGLFPPARLSLSEAIGNFAKYHSGEQAWMLRHFILQPPGDLLEARWAIATFPGLDRQGQKMSRARPSQAVL